MANWKVTSILIYLLKVSSGDSLFKIIPRLENKRSDGIPMKKMVAPLISQCAYLCATNDSCRGFHYNKISRECSLYNSQNHRDVGEDIGSKHFQIMPKECVPGIDEWFPDLNKCIHIDTTLVYHSEAQSRCHSLSKELMSLETIAKYNTVKALLNTFDVEAIHLYTKKVGTSSYQWRDGSSIPAHLWCPNQPSDETECLALAKITNCPDKGIDDYICTQGLAQFFCE